MINGLGSSPIAALFVKSFKKIQTVRKKYSNNTN